MTGEPGVDHPEAMAVVDVLAASRGDALMSFVETVSDAELVLTAGKDRSQRTVRMDVGERLELIWKGPEELRSLPATLVSVDSGTGEAKWRVRPAGPATRGQRRAAVRAPIGFRGELTLGKTPCVGVTVDISEGGMRILLDPAHGDGDDAPRLPEVEVGTVVPAAVDLASGRRVTCQAEVVRRHHREDARLEFSTRFIGLPEPQQDAIRRDVFAALRDLRSRGLI
jgi:hypothetical protein